MYVALSPGCYWLCCLHAGVCFVESTMMTSQDAASVSMTTYMYDASVTMTIDATTSSGFDNFTTAGDVGPVPTAGQSVQGAELSFSNDIAASMTVTNIKTIATVASVCTNSITDTCVKEIALQTDFPNTSQQFGGEYF